MASGAKILGVAGGVAAAIIIGFIAYGEMSKPAGSDILERPTIQWAVGDSLEENMVRKYRLFHMYNNYDELIVTLRFVEQRNQDWYTSIEAEDSKDGKNVQDILMTKSMIPKSPIEEHMRPYMRMVQSSILWIVDYAVTPKYLASGAVWGSIHHGVQKEDLKVIARENVVTEGGTFEAYVLSYTIKDKQSKIWVVQDEPIPVKAEVYDVDGNLQFRYELIEG